MSPNILWNGMKIAWKEKMINFKSVKIPCLEYIYKKAEMEITAICISSDYWCKFLMVHQ